MVETPGPLGHNQSGDAVLPTIGATSLFPARRPETTTVKETSVTQSYSKRRLRWRVLVLILVFGCAAVLLGTGRDLATALLTLFGVGLAGVTIARWVVDGAPLPALSAVLGPEVRS